MEDSNSFLQVTRLGIPQFRSRRRVDKTDPGWFNRMNDEGGLLGDAEDDADEQSQGKKPEGASLFNESLMVRAMQEMPRLQQALSCPTEWEQIEALLNEVAERYSVLLATDVSPTLDSRVIAFRQQYQAVQQMWREMHP